MNFILIKLNDNLLQLVVQGLAYTGARQHRMETSRWRWDWPAPPLLSSPALLFSPPGLHSDHRPGLHCGPPGLSLPRLHSPPLPLLPPPRPSHPGLLSPPVLEVLGGPHHELWHHHYRSTGTLVFWQSTYSSSVLCATVHQMFHPLRFWNCFWKRTKILFVLFFFGYFDQNESNCFNFSKQTNLIECIRSNFQNEQTKTKASVPIFKVNRLKWMHSFQFSKQTD